MDLLTVFGNFLKIVPGLILLPLSAYLGLKKVGTKATISYTLTKKAHTAGNISSAIISNKKDKPIVLHDIFIKINNDTTIEVKKFHPPLVIKGLETLLVEFEDVSSYSDGERDVDFFSLVDEKNLVGFYANTPDSCLKFQIKGVASPMIQAYGSNSPFIVPVKQDFKGIIYGKNIRWAVVYKFYDIEKTCLINDGGIVLYDWPFSPLTIESKNLENANLIKEQILNSPLNGIITDFMIYDLSGQTRNKYTPVATHFTNKKPT